MCWIVRLFVGLGLRCVLPLRRSRVVENIFQLGPEGEPTQEIPHNHYKDTESNQQTARGIRHTRQGCTQDYRDEPQANDDPSHPIERL
jgi:hypothetical protein